MKVRMKTRHFLLGIILYVLCMVTACGREQQDKRDIVNWEDIVQDQTEEERHTDAERIAEIYRNVCGEASQEDLSDDPGTMKNIIGTLGENGYTAVDSDNQINMTNAGRVLAFCDSVDAKEHAELTIIEVINREDAQPKVSATCRFRIYHFQTENGRVDISRSYYCFDENGNAVSEDTVRYHADVWQLTEEGYLVFEGNYFADDYYIISLTDEPEYSAFRVEPLDTGYRDLYHKYIQPVGYEDNNLFLTDWTEEDFEKLEFYDLFDRFYPMACQQSVPYKASENPGIGMVYRIAEKEFEGVIGRYLNIDMDVLRSRTAYFPSEKTYEYKPRGFYEIGSSNMPYPEVVDYSENGDNTITLTVNAVFPYQCTSKAFSHEVVIRLLENGGFQYVSNKILDGNYDAWWYTSRLTDDEWDEIYAKRSTDQDASESDDLLWYLPHAEDCLLTEAEREVLRNEALDAADQVRKVYQNVEIEDGASYASNVRDFSRAQRKEVVTLLGRAGYVSVTEDANMENYQSLEAFYEEYENGREAMVTVYEVKRDGLIGAVTFIYRKIGKEDAIQTYYIGVGWQEGGVPTIKNTLVSDVAEMNLTEKGYMIYTYKEQIVHSDACQYLRVKPLSEKCRELTEKYIAGLSFVNYNAFVTNWDSSNVEDILMPCMFEDIYRIYTGENIKAENDQIPAEVYERIMTTYFPVSKEQLRAKCGYDADSGTYPYEMIFAVPHAPFGEVVDYSVSSDGKGNADGTITLFVDGVWIDYNSDCAFTDKIVVQPFADGTFRYLSNEISFKSAECSELLY